MKKDLRFSISFLVTVFLMFPPCRAWAGLNPEVQEIVKLNRPQFNVQWDAEEQKAKFAELLYPYDPYEDDSFALQIPDKLYDPRLVVYKKQALGDVDFLFSMLKYGYAGYQYFGGDESFLSAKEGIKKELEDRNLPTISILEFREILYRHLNFINDGHFDIYYKRLKHRISMYMNFDYAFLQDSEGYYLETHGGKEYLKLVNDRKLEEFMKASLDDDGRITYRIGVLETEGQKGVSAELTLVSNAEQRNLPIILEEVVSHRIQEKEIYQHKTIDGIPVITVRAFPYKGRTTPEGYNPQDYQLIEEFFLDAHELRGVERLIIDIRSHRGGDSYQPVSWIRNFTGTTFGQSALISASLATKTAQQLNQLRMVQEGNAQPYHSVSFRPTASGWSEIWYHLPDRIENEALVVVLMDSWTASAGELFVYYLSQLDNVVFLGMNSAGVINFGSPVKVPLPNSKLPVLFGTHFSLPLDLTDREGIGFLPDFWIRPEYALDLAIKFIKGYKK